MPTLSSLRLGIEQIKMCLFMGIYGDGCYQTITVLSHCLVEIRLNVPTYLLSFSCLIKTFSMALDEVQASKGAFDAPDDRDFSAEHILGAEPVPLPDYVNLNIVPSHDQKRTFHCTSYGLTHVVEILNTLEHNMQIELDPEEQWRHQKHPPDGAQVQPPAIEDVGDSLQHALRIFMHFGLENHGNNVNVPVFKAEGYAAIQKTLADYRRWLALGFPVYSGWLGHCFAIVGYDDKRKQLICKNSYGATWGGKADGTFEIDYFDIPRLFTGYIIYDLKDLMHIFKDVTDKSPFAEAIKFCRDQKFVNGYGEGTDPTQKLFMPDKAISRAELCQILFNIFKNKQL
jgi:hypothetical protein